MKTWFRLLCSVCLLLLITPARFGATPQFVYGPEGFKPNAIRATYGFDQLPYTGAGETIAIIGAFDYPQAGNDLAYFINQFGLPTLNGLPGGTSCTAAAGPHPCFQDVPVASANQDAPLFWSYDSTWAMEMGANIQWSHAIAPGANILLMRAKTNQTPDLLKAVDEAVALGADVVSMSWGYPETGPALNWNTHFQVPGVAFVAAAGNNGTQLLFPASSPHVLAVGGTQLDMNFSTGAYFSESASRNGRGGTVGGASVLFQAPAWQPGPQRQVPDVAYAAGFAGFAVWAQNKWYNLGGSSMGTPQWAAMIALVNEAKGGTNWTDYGALYASAADPVLYASLFRDISTGWGACRSDACAAGTGYDIATGLGTPKAQNLVPYLASH